MEKNWFGPKSEEPEAHRLVCCSLAMSHSQVRHSLSLSLPLHTLCPLPPSSAQKALLSETHYQTVIFSPTFSILHSRIRSLQLYDSSPWHLEVSTPLDYELFRGKNGVSTIMDPRAGTRPEVHSVDKRLPNGQTECMNICRRK